MKWRLAPQAERDIVGIADYIALNSPRAANDLVERFRQRWRLLTTQPYSGPARPDIAPDIRPLVIGSYLTLYRVTPDHIEILRVLHGRRNIGEGEPLQGG